MSLTDREKRFVAEYCIDLNASAAARRAGYSTSYASTGRLTQRPEIAAAIAAQEAPILARAEITAERVLRELARVAFADPRKLVDAQGRVKGLQEIDDDTAGAIALLRLEEKPEGRRVLRIRLHDKIAALVVLARHLGLLHDRLEIGLGDGGGDGMAKDYAAAQDFLL